MVYKWCVVPKCTSTSINSPDKLFVSVPTNVKKRKMWLQLARRDPKSILSHSNVFMCEDHFDMEKDTINYMKYKMGFSQKILLTDEAVPTKFNCQEDRKRRVSNARSSRKVLIKRQRTDLVTECLQSQSATETHPETVESLQKDDYMIQEIIEPEVFKRPKTNAEKCRDYKIRKKLAAGIKKDLVKKSNAEQCRMYRLRKKMLAQGYQSSMNEVLCTPSTSNTQMTFGSSPLPVTTDKMEEIYIKKEYENEDNEEMNYNFAFVNVNETGTFQETVKEEVQVKLEYNELQNEVNDDINLANVSNVSIHDIKSEIDIEEYSHISSEEDSNLVNSEPITDLIQGLNQDTIETNYVKIDKIVIKSKYKDVNNIDLRSTNVLQETVDNIKNELDIEEDPLVLCKYEDNHMEFESIEVSENSINQERTEENINVKKVGATCNEISNELVQTGIKIFSCEICNKTFNQKSNFKTHMRTHTGEKCFECNICHKKCTQLVNLTNHMRTHTGKRNFKCKVCDKTFVHPSTLKNHMQIHTAVKNYECNICNKKFTLATTLTGHMLIHTGERKFVCNICDSRFTRSSTLKKHMRIHSGEKRFVCEVCNKKFVESGNLKTHLRTHTGEKRFECVICNKKFTQSHNMRIHMRIHTEEEKKKF